MSQWKAEFGAPAGPTLVSTEAEGGSLADFASEPVEPSTEPVPPTRLAESPQPEPAGATHQSAEAPNAVYPDLPLRSLPTLPHRPYAPPPRGRRRAAAGLIGTLMALVIGAHLYPYRSWTRNSEPSQAPVALPGAAPSSGAADARSETPRARAQQRETLAEGPDTRTQKPAAASTPPADEAGDAATAANGGAASVTSPAAESESLSLSGAWFMNTQVESSRLGRYEGLRLAYQLRLRQSGTQLTGTGYKVRENERAVRTQTPITLRGEVQGDRVLLTFTELGTRRRSAGKLVLDRETADVMRGRFSSDAAQSAGVAEVRR